MLKTVVNPELASPTPRLTPEQWDSIHNALLTLDEELRAKGYGVAYRRLCHFENIADAALMGTSTLYGTHVETLYIQPMGDSKTILAKVLTDGTVVRMTVEAEAARAITRHRGRA